MRKHKQFILVMVLFLCILLPKTYSQAATISDSVNSYLPIEVDTEFAGGSGTEADPYLISNAEQLELYRNYYGFFGTDTNYFALTNDIYLNKDYEAYTTWNKTAPAHTLTAANGHLSTSSFDGRGYTIYGVYADENSFLPAGMTDAEIKNVNFSHFYCKNTALVANYFSGTYAGNINISNGIIEYDQPALRDCYGGVFMDATAYINETQCLENININADMTVNQKGFIGMIAGQSSSTKIKNCSTSGSLTYNYNDGFANLGGLFGRCGSISNCTNGADIIVNLPASDETFFDLGGVAGSVHGMLIPSSDNEYYPVTVSGCKNTGSVTVNTKYTLKYAADNKLTRQYYNVGGIIASTGENTTVKNCINEGDITVAFGNFVAGIVAELKGNIINCLNTGRLTGDSNYLLSGIVCRVYGNVSHCENRGDITSVEQMTDKHTFFVSASVSGIVSTVKSSGDGKMVAVKYCKNTGNITVSDESQWTYVAGIAASVCYDSLEENPTPISLTYCYNTGKLTGPTIGGIVASSSGTEEKNNTIKYCVNEGELYQPYNDDRFAGISCFTNYTEVSYCYNLGRMTSDYNKYRDRTGQIVGMNNNAIVKKCYILNKTANSIRGIATSQSGGKYSDIVRKTKATMLKYKTVKKIIKNAGYR